MHNHSAFPDYLAYLLNKYQLSQRKLAMKSGLNYVTINRFIRGKQSPELDSIDRLAKGLGCSEGERYGMHLCADNAVGHLVRLIQSASHFIERLQRVVEKHKDCSANLLAAFTEFQGTLPPVSAQTEYVAGARYAMITILENLRRKLPAPLPEMVESPVGPVGDNAVIRMEDECPL